MNQRTLSGTLSSDFGAPAPVVKMRPGGRPSYGEPPPPMAPYLPEAQELNDDHTRVSAGEAARAVWPIGSKESREQQRKYNDWQREQKAAQEAAAASQSVSQPQTQDPGYRDISTGQKDNNGVLYVYRQFSNGDIAIIRGAPPSGWTQGQVGPKDGQWRAITDAIDNTAGPYPTTDIGDQVSQQMSKAQAFFRSGLSAFQESDLATSPEQEEKKDNTLLYVGLGIGGVVALGLIVMAATRGKD